jgi:vitamin B12 transporter
MRKVPYILFVAAISVLPVTALCQAIPEEGIPEIVVTATRLPTPVDEVSGTILVIDSEDIEETQARTIADALTGIPGIDLVNQGGLGKTSSVLLRGGHTRFTLVLIDGVEVNDPSNPERTFDFAHLTTDNIDRIEVLFGPQSTLYGSDAIGGVIQIFTKKGSDEPEVEVSAEAGSFQTRRAQAAVRGSTGRTSYSLSASSVESDGISIAAESDGNTEKDGYENLTLEGHMGFETQAGFIFELNARTVDARNDLDHYGGPGGDDPNFTGEAEQMLVSGKVSTFITDDWEASLKVSSSTHDRNDLNEPDTDRPFTMELSYKGATRKTELVNNVFAGSHSVITIGLDSEEETIDSSFFSNEFGTDASVLEGQSATINGIFLQEQYTAGSGLAVTLGARRDDHSRFGEETTWRTGFSAPISEDVRFRAVCGTGFRAPSIDQLFNSEYGNADLEAERSLGWDAGLEWSPNRSVNASLSWHLTEYDNLIAWFDADGDPSTWDDGSYENISKAETEGVDFSINARIKTVSLGLTGSFLRTRDDQGEQLLRRPGTRWGARLGFAPTSGISLSLNSSYVGERKDWGDVTLDNYTLVNMTGTFRISNAVELLGRVENLTNEEYEQADGYGTPGRSAYLGIKADL